ncbi:MAG: aminotransferase class I/II-fold pyridoxal phosphate-dependent enzyme [Saprospiraceae bacterium]
MKEYHLLQKAFEAEEFRKKGHDLVNQLADMLECVQRKEGNVTNPTPPNDLLHFWQNMEPMTTTDFFQKVMDQSIKIHHPRYTGHQVSAPLPISALSNLVTGLLNNGMGIYEMGEGATAIEKKVVEIFCTHLGFSEGDGILTSGGTLANLTGLLAARAQYNGKHVWTEGTMEQYCIMVSEMAHYCVDRAVKIMGWGDEGIIKVPVNKDYSMDVNALSGLLSKAQKQGKKVLAIVGSAPCTATGSYDDLNALANFCQKENIWFHIDAAHGGPAIFSKKYKHLMNGADRADSVVIDAHKMMLTPALTTALLFKNASDSYNTFSQDAHYLWEGQEDREWYNIAKRTFECTKVMMAVRVLTIINEYGINIFDDYVTRQYDLARNFAALIDDFDDFELATLPDANIVCFRYICDANNSDSLMLSKINKKIRKSIFLKGKHYLVQTQLHDGLYLRVTLMNALTTMEDLTQMVEVIRKLGQEIIDIHRINK